MELPIQINKQIKLGDAAVEGLMYGIVAGLVMTLFVVAFEWLAGVMPLEVLSYFGVDAAAPPWVGLFTHVAVSGIYGVVFGMLALGVARALGERMNPGVRLGLGVLYGLLIFLIAEWIILPRTASPLAEMSVWALALAHALYGAVLAWLVGRKA
ncbi:MAG: hypothetical protein IT331_05160 [Anaerolineae bacterium]|nr:hypothetical protein [Anaerolineae bacterium]